MPRYTRDDVLDGLSLCFGCETRRRREDSCYCTECEAEAEIVSAAIADSRAHGDRISIASLRENVARICGGGLQAAREE